MPTPELPQRLERLYAQWHQFSYVGTDPLSLVWQVPPEDREAAALLASSLALGRADLAAQAARELIEAVGGPLHQRLQDPPLSGWASRLNGLRYRFFSETLLANFLDSVGSVLQEWGTLQRAWSSSGHSGWEALDAFCGLFHQKGDVGILVPRAQTKSAAKRINLFLRWMVRHDEVDPGGWNVLRPADLWMPVDTHVLQWARQEDLTQRRAADRTTCREITERLREIAPNDPLRFDFSITREGMDKKGTLSGNRSFLTGLPQSRPL